MLIVTILLHNRKYNINIVSKLRVGYKYPLLGCRLIAFYPIKPIHIHYNQLDCFFAY